MRWHRGRAVPRTVGTGSAHRGAHASDSGVAAFALSRRPISRMAIATPLLLLLRRA